MTLADAKFKLRSQCNHCSHINVLKNNFIQNDIIGLTMLIALL